jgi:hypothetical protein
MPVVGRRVASPPLALTSGQLEPDERWRHAFRYGDNSFVMANIASPSTRLWRKLFGYGEYCLAVREPMAETIWLWRILPRRPRAYGGNYLAMANIGILRAIIERSMANIRLLMANIETLMAKITSRYGEKYSGMAKIL